MPVVIPDPVAASQREAAVLTANRQVSLYAALDRVLADAPFVSRDRALAGLAAFHRERMAKIPSSTKYPESAPWVEYVLAVDRGVQRLAGLSDEEMALYRSLHDYLAFRGFGLAAAAPGAEKCRVAYVPESDRGRVQFKNVDDPATHWKPEGPPTHRWPKRDQTLWSDGVGSGMHLDDEPEETFPLPVRQMLPQLCADVPGTVEFLTRYSSFWGRANMLFHDAQKRSVAIEKCSYNYIEVFYPGPDGISHISGMTCRDASSPLGRYQEAQRRKYLAMFNRLEDSPDMAFWSTCRKFEEKLASSLAAMGPRPRFEDIVRLFTTPWPEGLNKTGQRLHPKQGLIGYTLMSYGILLDEGRMIRWQRSAPPELKYPDQPEVYEFT